MKITHKSLMVNFETEVKLGNNDAIELTLVHQAFISKNSGELEIDIELMDVENVKFLGIEIEQGYKEFTATLLPLGIDLDKLINEKSNEIENMETKIKLASLFKDKL